MSTVDNVTVPDLPVVEDVAVQGVQVAEVALVGPQGPVGPGVAAGGTTSDLLVKSSGTDYDTSWSDEIVVDALTIDTTADEGTPSAGQFVWNTDEGTVDVGLPVTDGYFHLGQETLYRVSNKSGGPLSKGQVVRFDGTVGNSGRLLADLFDASTDDARTVMGLVAFDIPNDEDGYVVAFGKVRKVDTDVVGWLEGDILYADPATPGGLTKTRPQSPNAIVTVAALVTKSAQVGEYFVRPTFAPQLTETQDVRLTSPSDGEVLTYDLAQGLWVNSPVPADAVASVNGATGTVVLGPTEVQSIGTAVGLYVYEYGTAIPSVRPSALAVYWQGTAVPGTAISRAGDLWYDTTGD